MIKVIIFDFDGVLAESVDVKTRAFAELFKPEGAAAVKKIVGYHLRHTGVSRFEKFRYIYGKILKRPLSGKEFGLLCRKFSCLVTDEVIKAPYVKGAGAFLKKFHKKYDIFVASATPQREMRHIIKRRAMAPYFKKVYGSPRSKEDIVRMAIKESGVSPSEAVYIGDAGSDYSAAAANGVKFIARLGGAKAPLKNAPCPKIKDLRNLKCILDR